MQLLSNKKDYLLEQLGSLMAFDICTGFNGKVWLKAESHINTILIMNCLKQVVDKLQELQDSQPQELEKYTNVY